MTERIEQRIEGAVWSLCVEMRIGQDCSAAYDVLSKQLNLRPLAEVLKQPCQSQCMWGGTSMRTTDVVTGEGLNHYHEKNIRYQARVSTYHSPNLVKAIIWGVKNHPCYSFSLSFRRWEGGGLSQSETRGLLALIPAELLKRTWLFVWDSSATLSWGNRLWRSEEWLTAMDQGKLQMFSL